MSTHHLDDDHLVAYAAGTLSEGWSVAVVTHLAFCPSCRKQLNDLESIGGFFLDCVEVETGTQGSWERLKVEILSADTSEKLNSPPAAKVSNGSNFPEPLNSYFNSTKMRWKPLGLGAAQIKIPTKDASTSVRLLKIPAGQPVPEHGHGGVELTLVIDGAFRDGNSLFQRGDIQIADGSLTHQPIATDDRDCVCLAVTDAPLRFSSRLVRVLQPLLGI